MLWKKDGKGNLKNFCMVLVSVLYAPLFLPTVCKETYSKQLASDIATQPLTKQQLCGGHITTLNPPDTMFWHIWTFHVRSCFSNIETGRRVTGDKAPGTTLSISMKIEIVYLQIWQGLVTY